MRLARGGFTEELSFHLGFEKSIEFTLAEESKDNQGRAKSGSKGLEELCDGKTESGTPHN